MKSVLFLRLGYLNVHAWLSWVLVIFKKEPWFSVAIVVGLLGLSFAIPDFYFRFAEGKITYFCILNWTFLTLISLNTFRLLYKRAKDLVTCHKAGVSILPTIQALDEERHHLKVVLQEKEHLKKSLPEANHSKPKTRL